MNKKYKSFLDFLNKQYEKLNGIREARTTYEERINLSLYLAEYVVQGQQMYLFPQGMVDKKDLIHFDNAISKMANLLFEKLEGLIKYYLESKQNLGISIDRLGEVVDMRNKMLFISARWNNLRVMDVFDMNRERNKQKVPRRLPLLEEPCFCYDRVLETAMGIMHDDGFNPIRGVICMPPSSGKTFNANTYTNLMLMHFWLKYGESGIIRMTNNAENAKNYGNQCATMIEDNLWQEIFPEIKKYINAKGQMDCFKNRSAEKLLLKDCNSEVSDSIFMFGAEAGINGKRSMLGAVLDDLSNGMDDMDNDELHKKLTDKVMGDVMDRSDDDNSPIIVQGTMYNQYDTQNSFIDMWESRGLKKLRGFKFVRVTPDGKCFTCLVDIEDSNGNSIAPLLYTNEKLKEKKDYFANRGKPYVYNLIYRQQKDQREPKTFDLQFLDLYDFKKDKSQLDSYAMTMIDTTRKSGNDFFSMPIFRLNKESGKHRLVDVLFVQKSLGIVDDPNNVFAKKVCNKIIDSNITECCIENNTSNTTSALLKELCNAMNYNSCKFRERYTSKKGKGSTKVVRILNMEETIKNYIEFPDPTTLPVGHNLRLFMQYLTKWSSTEGQKKTNPDDAPDSLAMYAEEFIFKKQRLGEIIPIRSFW